MHSLLTFISQGPSQAGWWCPSKYYPCLGFLHTFCSILFRFNWSSLFKGAIVLDFDSPQS